MPRYKLTLEYDGTAYAGWQRQSDQPSVQEAIIDAVFKFSGSRTDVVGAGRTDAGVHAVAQVAHVDLPKEIDPFRVMQGINFYLFNPNGTPEEENSEIPANRIAITNAELVADDFSARFSASKRHYFYRIINRRARLGLEAGRAWHVVEPLDENLMHKAAQSIIGHHDFTSFRDSACQSKSPIKTLERFDVIRKGDEIHLLLNARSFLHHQVRIMAGSLAMVGKGRWKPAGMLAALEAKNRAEAGPTAPPGGLYLMQVDYP